MDKYNLKEVAIRLKSLREMTDTPIEKIAKQTGVTVAEYNNLELGECDFSFNFLYNCAKTLGCDITELITGDSAKLNSYMVTRAGEGMPIERRSGFNYLHLASNLKGRIAEPFMVTVPYDAAADTSPIKLNSHEGQEMDYIIEGALKVNIDGHETVLNVGDTIYYNSGKQHGMVATAGRVCKFLAIVLNKDTIKN